MSIIKYFSPGSKNCARYEDAELLRMIIQGGLQRRTAINCLHERLFYMVGLMLKKHRVLTPEQAHEGFADSLLSIIDIVLSGKTIDDVRKFFYTVFSRKCIDIIRRNSTNSNINQKVIPFSKLAGKNSDKNSDDYEKIIMNKTASGSDPSEMLEAGAPEAEAIRARQTEVRQKIRRSFGKLRDKCRQIIKCQWDNYSMDEIATHCNVQTPRQTAYNCRKNLAKYLAQEGLTLDMITGVFDDYQQEFYQLLASVDDEK